MFGGWFLLFERSEKRREQHPTWKLTLGGQVKTLEITEAQASALVAIAGRISASDADVIVETPISEPVAEPTVESDEFVLGDYVSVIPVTSASSMPTFASAQVIAEPVVQEESPVVSAKADAKAERKAENKAINAQINAQLANATKASDKGDRGAVVQYLNNAMALVPTRTNKDGSLTWQGTVNRIVAKAEALEVASA